jgi:hypothetical protein
MSGPRIVLKALEHRTEPASFEDLKLDFRPAEFSVVAIRLMKDGYIDRVTSFRGAGGKILRAKYVITEAGVEWLNEDLFSEFTRVAMTPEQKQFAILMGGGNFSKGVREVIKASMKQFKENQNGYVRHHSEFRQAGPQGHLSGNCQG